MKISLNWIKEFTSLKVDTDELIAKIGAQIGEVEEVIFLGERYKGIVVAKVVSCEKHPNADKLSVCKIDDGGVVKNVKRDEDGLVQVVCGAPNVRKGLSVAWLPPGAIVPSSYDTDQFKLDARELRGEISNGMLASGKELGINDDHDGILVVDKIAKPGTPLADVYQLDDVIIDIENKMFTHRPDCFGIIGVAREIAGIQHIRFASPDWYLKSLPIKAGKGDPLPLKVKNELPKLVPRFMAVPLSGVQVQKSPVIMQSFLYRLGIKPINNVVDITNFVMLLTAQPLHAYDYDKVLALQEPVASSREQVASLVVRHPKSGEKIHLLNGKAIEPHEKAIMIASRDKLLGIGGVMGGRDTEVDKDTKNIILEAASFDMYSIRKTSMIHGLFTDAVTRFNKGQSPLQNDVVLTYAVGMLQKFASAELAGDVIDTAPELSVPFGPPVKVGINMINDRLGLQLSHSAIQKLLEATEFAVSGNTTLQVKPPFWRTDIEIAEDVIEEVGRLYGYDRLPHTLPQRSIVPVAKDDLLTFKSRIRNILAAGGANEVLTYSFVHGKLMQKTDQDSTQAYELSNALSPELQYFRLSLTPSLLDKVHSNIKAGHDSFALFELNKAHNKTHLEPTNKNLPKEFQILALVFAANDKLASSLPGAAYYQARAYLDYLAESLGLTLEYTPAKEVLNYPITAPFEPSRSAMVSVAGSEVGLGIIGEYKASVIQSLKLPKLCAGFEIGLEELMQVSRAATTYRPLGKFPSAQQDITLSVEPKIAYTQVAKLIEKSLARATKEHGYDTSLHPVDIYQKEPKSRRSMTFRISLAHPGRTLVTDEVNKLLDTIAAEAKKHLGATRH